ncbi:hypothetical protein OAG11_02745 [Verrucomicrobia bacterium]|nr:hypothetical protein [Verrucomicrobiota bacterium]
MKLIFSEESLEAATSPDEMDHPSQIVRAHYWVPLLGIGGRGAYYGRGGCGSSCGSSCGGGCGGGD